MELKSGPLTSFRFRVPEPGIISILLLTETEM